MGRTPGTRPPLVDRALGGRLALGLGAGLASAAGVLLLLALVQRRWSPLRNLDLGVARRLYDVAEQRPWLVTTLEVIDVVTAPATFQVTVGIVVLLLLRKRRRRLALWAAVTMYGGAWLSPAIKSAVERSRPVWESPVATETGWSFPSGHALNSLLGCAVLLVVTLPDRRGRAQRLAIVAGAAIVLVTGFDRVALGVHYVSDVLAGWLVALSVLAGTSVAFEWWRRRSGRRPDDPLGGLEDEGEREARSRR